MLPVHRAEPGWLRSAAASVRAQTLEDWVLHVVEDGCPDRSADALVDAWPADDTRLRLYRPETRRGQVAARTLALQEADAPWVALLDQDDEYLPTKLADQIAAAEASGAEVAYVDVAFVGPDGEDLPDRTEAAARARRADSLDGLDPAARTRRLFAGNVLDFPSTLFARAAYDRVDGFDRHHPGAADWAFWVELSASGAGFTHVPHPCYRKRVHPDSDGTRTLDERNLDFPAVAHELRRRHGLDGEGVDRREQDLRRRAARSALVLGRRVEALRLLRSMVAHGHAREAVEVLAEATSSGRAVRHLVRR